MVDINMIDADDQSDDNDLPQLDGASEVLGPASAAGRRSRKSTFHSLQDNLENWDVNATTTVTRPFKSVNFAKCNADKVEIPDDIDGHDLRTITIFITAQLKIVLQLGKIAIEHDRHRTSDKALAPLHDQLANMSQLASLSLRAQDCIVNILHYKRIIREILASGGKCPKNTRDYKDNDYLYKECWTITKTELSAVLPGEETFQTEWAGRFLEKHIGFDIAFDHMMKIEEEK